MTCQHACLASTPCTLSGTKGKVVGEDGGERKSRMAARQHRRAWEHERVELRAARVARTLCEFPLVSVLCLCRCVITVVVVAHLFLCRGR